MQRKKILWLCTWYPNQLELQNGDFIQRHASAASIYNDIHVVYVVRDLHGKITKGILKTDVESSGLRETIIYYYRTPFFIPAVDKIFSTLQYERIYKKKLKKLIDEEGKPALVHLHVGLKAASLAIWLKKKMNIRFVISEHWSGFLLNAKDKLENQSVYIQRNWKKAVALCSAMSTVSKVLANAILKKTNGIAIEIIPNVVDTSIFQPIEQIEPSFDFIHISGLEPYKNLQDILLAFSIVRKKRPSTTLLVIGPERSPLQRLIEQFLDNEGSGIHFQQQVPQSQLALLIGKTRSLILYSSFETFGCVVIEAHACGVPTMVSDIPVFHETVTKGEDGIFVPLHNASALAHAMQTILESPHQFNKQTIVDGVQKYNYKNVGAQFDKWYKTVMGES